MCFGLNNKIRTVKKGTLGEGARGEKKEHGGEEKEHYDDRHEKWHRRKNTAEHEEKTQQK